MHTTALLIASHDGWDHGPDGPWPFPFLFLGFWLVAIGTFLWFRRRDGGRRTGQAVLAERYARGDIDADEYRARRDVLQGKGQ
jgi:putative membrane protein